MGVSPEWAVFLHLKQLTNALWHLPPGKTERGDRPWLRQWCWSGAPSGEPLVWSQLLKVERCFQGHKEKGVPDRGLCKNRHHERNSWGTLDEFGWSEFGWEWECVDQWSWGYTGDCIMKSFEYYGKNIQPQPTGNSIVNLLLKLLFHLNLPSHCFIKKPSISYHYTHNQHLSLQILFKRNPSSTLRLISLLTLLYFSDLFLIREDKNHKDNL